MKIKKYLIDNIGIISIIFIAIIIHVIALNELSFKYNLSSDDLSYIESGLHFLKTGQITMHGVLSAQIMPGMTYLIALFGFIFGTGLTLWISLKILWLIMGVFSIYGVYKIVNLFTTKTYACIASLFLLAIDFIWMDNLILTETPFMVAFIFLIYNTFALLKTKNNKYYPSIIIWYLIAVLFKGNIAPYPLFLIAYYIWSKYEYKLLIKQMLLAGFAISIFFIPWTIRNYLAFNHFIPLTYGIGNPLLLGTYQGYNYPADNEIKYEQYAKDNMSNEMKTALNKSDNYMHVYYKLKYDELIAKYRMKQWWQDDKISMIKSYAIYKPAILVFNSFYWKEVLNIPIKVNILFRLIDLLLTFIAVIAILINKKYIKELIFLLSIYMFQIALYSYTFAFDRYGQTLYFIRFIIIGLGLSIIIPKALTLIKKMKAKHIK